MKVQCLIEFKVRGQKEPKQEWVDSFRLEWDRSVGVAEPLLVYAVMQGGEGKIEQVSRIEKFEIITFRFM